MTDHDYTIYKIKFPRNTTDKLLRLSILKGAGFSEIINDAINLYFIASMNAEFKKIERSNANG